MAKTRFDDLFNFDDKSAIQKGIDGLNELNAEYTRLIENVSKSKAKFTEAINEEAGAVKKLADSMKKLDVQRTENQKTIIDNAKIIDQSARKVQDLNKALKGAEQMEKMFGKSVDSLTQKLRLQEKLFKAQEQTTEKGKKKALELAKATRALRTEIKDMTDATRKQNNAFERAEGSYNDLTKKTNLLRQELKNLPGAFDKTAAGSAKFRKRSKELETQISRNNDKLKEFDKRIGDNFRNVGNYKGAINSATKSLKSFALQMTASTLGLMALFQAGKEGLKTFVDFEFTMAQVRAVSGATAEEFERLDALAKDLGSTTASTASDIASLELELSKLGFSTQEIIDATPAINQLAIAMGEDLGETAKTVASTINAFGLEAKEAASISNKFAAIANNSAVSLNEMGTIIGNVGKVADTAGLSLDTTLALVGKLKDNAQDASTASTSLRNILLELSSANSKLSKSVGFAVKNEEDLFKALDILANKGVDLNEVMGESAEEVGKLGEAAELTGKRTVTSLTILTDMRNEVKSLSTDVLEAEDALDKFSEIMSGTVKVAGLEAKSAMQGFAITLFDAVKPALKAVLAAVVTIFSAMSAGVKVIQENADLFKLLAIAIAGFKVQAVLATAATIRMTVVEKASAIATRLMAVSFRSLTAAMLANPIGLVVAGFAALVFALKKAEVFTDRYAKTQELSNEITKGAAEGTEVLNKAIEKLDDATEDLTESTKEEQAAIIDSTTATINNTLARITALKIRRRELAVAASELTLWQKAQVAMASVSGAAATAAISTQLLLGNLEEGTAESTKEIEALEKLLEQLINKREDFNNQAIKSDKEAAKALKALTKQQMSDLAKLQIFRLEQVAKRQEAEMEASNNSAESAAKLKDTLIQIETIKRDQLLAQDNLTASARALIMEQYAVTVEGIAGKISTKVTDQIISDIQRAQEAINNFKMPAGITLQDIEDFDDGGELEAEQEKRRVQLFNNEQNRQIQAFHDLETLRSNDEISTKDYYKRLNDLSIGYQQNVIDGLKNIFGSSREIQQMETDLMKQQNDEREEDSKETWKKIGQFAMQAFTIATDLATQITQRQVEDSEFRLERLEAERQRDVELAGDNQTQIDLINQKAEADREILEKKRTEALIKQAKVEKAVALVSAIVNTAKSVASVIAFPPLAALVGALGAVQIGIIAATPIPAFAEGTESAPKGYAIVAEEGPEAIRSTDGKTEIVAKPSIKKLKGGEKIYTATETRALARAQEAQALNTIGGEADTYINNYNSINDNALKRAHEKEVISMIKDGQQKQIEAISDMERFSFEGTARGLDAFRRRGQNVTELLNGRYG